MATLFYSLCKQQQFFPLQCLDHHILCCAPSQGVEEKRKGARREDQDSGESRRPCTNCLQISRNGIIVPHFRHRVPEVHMPTTACKDLSLQGQATATSISFEKRCLLLFKRRANKSRLARTCIKPCLCLHLPSLQQALTSHSALPRKLLLFSWIDAYSSPRHSDSHGTQFRPRIYFATACPYHLICIASPFSPLTTYRLRLRQPSPVEARIAQVIKKRNKCVCERKRACRKQDREEETPRASEAIESSFGRSCRRTDQARRASPTQLSSSLLEFLAVNLSSSPARINNRSEKWRLCARQASDTK